MNHLCFFDGRGSAETKCVFALLLAEQTDSLVSNYVSENASSEKLRKKDAKSEKRWSLSWSYSRAITRFVLLVGR